MGITFCSVHVYSTEAVAFENTKFARYSQGWQTVLPEDKDFSDPKATQRIAKDISRAVSAPVLWFFEFDSEAIYMKIFQQGKQISSYDGSGFGSSKKLLQIPLLIGYENSGKRRFTKILGCADIDLRIKLLEEFFGVCLLPFPEMADENRSALSRVREEKLFKSYEAEEKKLTGKHAAVEAEVVQELDGVLYGEDWNCQWFDEKQVRRLPHFKPHYYLYCKRRVTGEEYIPVHFCNGKIQFIDQEEMRRDGADRPYPHHYIGDNPNYEQRFFPNKLIFLDTAPAAYRGKEFLLPNGFYGLGFDAKDRLLLYDSNNTFAVVDKNTKIIAKKRLKGKIWDTDGDYILTLERKGLSDRIRVYRIFDKG